MNSHSNDFDVMRSVAILMILLHHLPEYTYNYYQVGICKFSLDLSFINELNRYFSLSVFIFLSGYLISDRYPSFITTDEIRTFLVKRYLRLMPLYIAALAAYCVMTSNYDLISFFVHAFGLQILLAPIYGNPMLTLWYIGLIIPYYYVLIIINRNDSVSKKIITVISIVLFYLMVHNYYGVIDDRFIFYFFIFLAGMLCSRYKLLRRLLLKHLILIIPLFFFCIGVYVKYFYPWFGNDGSVTPSKRFVFFIIIQSLMLSFLFITYVLSKYIISTDAPGIFEKVSFNSYCIFLFHRPIWWLMSKIIRVSDVHLKLVFLVIVGIPVIYFVSYNLQNLYDKTIEPRIKKCLSMS